MACPNFKNGLKNSLGPLGVNQNKKQRLKTILGGEPQESDVS
jgi:hypothetical protein